MKKYLLFIGLLAISAGAFQTQAEDFFGGRKLLSYTLTDEEYPSEVEEVRFVYNTDAVLEKIQDGHDVVTILRDDPQPGSITITKVDSDYDVTRFELTLNEAGYIVKAVESENGKVEATYTFTYDADGQLINMEKTEPGYSQSVESYAYTWTNGDITAVKMVESEYGDVPETITVTITPSDIENKSSLMLYDAYYGLDIDELEHAYFAGLLGRPSKHLPLEASAYENGNLRKSTCTWTLDGKGFPSKVFIDIDDVIEPYDITITFEWQEFAGVEEIEAAVNAGNARIFGIDGTERTELHKGLNIVRSADGSVSKIMK